MKKSTAELWVKIIAIIGFIGAVFAVIGGIAMLLGGTFLSAIIPFMENGMFQGAFVGAFFIVTAIVTLALGVFMFIVALNLWKHQNWARIVMIIFAIFGVISSLPSLLIGTGIIGLIINGGIFYLLTFQKDIIKLFR